MYSIDIKYGDLKKDLLVTLITNFTLSEEVYFIIFNLYSL